ncbi:UGSC family (seleno)protein [Plantactinospora endophytica]|uniref:UGSC family (seleno)protein n=1 Tax=Plantactinospora endophytica TaxID=673535 RepID=UPI003FD8A003
MAFEPLVRPIGAGELTANTTPASRPETIRGRTLGLPNNTEPNAAVLLHKPGGQLRRGYGVWG